MAGIKETLTSDGQTAERASSPNTIVHIEGNFGGGTAALQMQTDAGEWVSLQVATTGTTWYLPSPGSGIRVLLTSSTTPSLDVYIFE